MSGSGLPQQRNLRQLVEELKTPGLEQSRQDEILVSLSDGGSLGSVIWETG